MASNPIQGVFSSRTGAGNKDDLPDDIQKSYWFVQELEDGNYEVQALNSSNMPSGPKLSIDQDRFLSNYQPEPEYYAYKVLPNIRKQSDRIVRGEGHRYKEEVYSAEYEFSVAVEVDEDNVRANFGLGLTYLDRGELDRAEDVFRRLVRLQAIYAPEHKHLFNEFGIKMRKCGMYDQALEYYHKAEILCRNDEHLYLNMSRAYFEKGDLEGCIHYLDKCLILDSDFEEAKQFKAFLKLNGFMDNYGKAAVSESEMQSYYENGKSKVSKDESPEMSISEQLDSRKKKVSKDSFKIDF